MTPDATAALVIAGGGASGFSIATAPWGTGSVLEHVMATVREAGIVDIVAVLGDAAEDIVERAEMGEAVLVIDPEWREGLAASIRCGLDELMRHDEVASAVLVSVDQPSVSADVIRAVAKAQREEMTMAALPKYRYATGLPIAAHRDLWPRLMGLEGDARPEALLKTHAEWVTEVWVDLLPPPTVRSAYDLESIAPRG